MNILGISAYNHDAAAALVQEGQVIAAAQEERFKREKGYAGFPSRAARFCLDYAGLKTSDLDAIVFYDKPGRRLDRLVKTHLGTAPSGFWRFVGSAPGWLGERAGFRLRLRNQLFALDRGGLPKPINLLFAEHHLSHAASAFYPSPFEESAILTMDGAGEWPSVSLCRAQGESMEVLSEQHYPNSAGLFYSAFSRFLGFDINGGEYKLMALSAYGNENSTVYKKFREQISNSIIHVQDDGSFALQLEFFNRIHDPMLFSDDRWEQLFTLKRRRPEEPLLRRHANLALAVQRVLEGIVLRSARHLKKLSSSRNLCFSGGVALNSMVNGRLEREGIFDRVWIPPAPGDSGGAIGAALAAYHLHFGRPRVLPPPGEHRPGSCLGPEYTAEDIRRLSTSHGAVFEELSTAEIIERSAEALSHGKILAWFHGRLEFGPRALGNRNILADPRDPNVQRKINLKVKFRESFRPLSPLIGEEDAEALFGNGETSPYMSFSRKLRERYRRPLPWNYATLTIKEKLHTRRSDFPAITLVDMSARVQTVNPLGSPRLYSLLQAFREKSGCPLLASTSFNIRSKPLVNTPEEAFQTFMNSELDVLVMENFYFEKSRQPEWELTPLYNL